MVEKTNLFIVGKPKTGTTTIHNALSEHEDVFMSEIKEPARFASDLVEEARSYKDSYVLPFADNDKYDSLFAGQDEAYLGESTTTYLWSERAAQEIHSYNPDAKIIAFFRKPTRFLRSLFYQYRSQGFETAASFEEAWSLQNDRKQGENIPKGVEVPSLLQYRERLNYGDQIQRFFDVFPKDQILVKPFLQLKENPEQLASDIVEFLHLSGQIQIDEEYNPTQQPRSMKLRQLAYAKPIRYVISQLPPSVYNRLSNIWQQVILTDKEKNPLPPTIRDSIRSYAEPQVKKLSSITDTDFYSLWYESESN